MDPLNDGRSSLELISHMGSDLDIVNDARASFGKVSETLTDRDCQLISYLIQHNHTSPLRGVVFKFRVKAPLFVCRQWWKHTIASSHLDEQVGWNEQSFRYVEVADEQDYYCPTEFRLQSTSNRQATEGVLNRLATKKAKEIYYDLCHRSFDSYRKLLELGVGREQARAVLVPAVYTTFVWTVSLQAVLNFIGLRLGKGAQSEITAYAAALRDLIAPIVPITIQNWEKYHG